MPAILAEVVYPAVSEEGGIKCSLVGDVCLNSPAKSLCPALSWSAVLGVDWMC